MITPDQPRLSCISVTGRAPGALLIACLLVLLQGCGVTAPAVPQSGPRILLTGMVIRNELAYPVRDVMIQVPKTGRFAGCGNILPRSECRTRFETVEYGGHPMVVSWTEHGQPFSTGEFETTPGAAFDPAVPAWLEVRIFAAGQAGARLLQRDP